MALTERLRVAQVRSRRDRNMGEFLSRLMDSAAFSAGPGDLLDVEESEAFVKRLVSGREEARRSGTHRRSPALSREALRALGLALRAQVPDFTLRVLFERYLDMGALAVGAHRLLGDAPGFADMGELAFGATEDGASGLAVDFLPPGDREARHPEGSYELSVWGPAFKNAEVEGLG